MEERERCYSFILSRTPHETLLLSIYIAIYYLVTTPDHLVESGVQKVNRGTPRWTTLVFHESERTLPSSLNNLSVLHLSENLPLRFYFIIIIIRLLIPTRRTGHIPPRGPCAGWWVLTTANAPGSNGLTCLPKHGGTRVNEFLVTHPMTDQRCLTSAIARRSALTAGHRAPHGSI
jgi:hypothetical protein